MNVKTIIDAIFPQYCLVCQTRKSSSAFCYSCTQTVLPCEHGVMPDIEALFYYRGAIRLAVQRIKFEPNETIAHRLLEFCQQKQYLPQRLDEIHQRHAISAVTFVPIHWRRRYTRRFDFSSILAKRCARLLKVPFTDTLISHRYSKPLSSTSSREEREQLVKSRFALLKKPRGKHILLVDDVRTTGVTLKVTSDILCQFADVTSFALAQTPLAADLLTR